MLHFLWYRICWKFDQLGKDLRAETMMNGKFPDNMSEAIALAEKYDDLKGRFVLFYHHDSLDQS